MQPEDFVQPEVNYQIPEVKKTEEESEVAQIKLEAKEAEPQLKDSVTSAADVAISAAQIVNPGWQGLANETYPGKDFENDPDIDTFNPVSKDMQPYYSEVPLDKAHLLHDTKSSREFMHVFKQIHMAGYNEQVVADNTNMAGGLALMAAASFADPFSNSLYSAFAGLTKVTKLGNILETASRPARAGTVGSVGAVVEGSTEALIQDAGGRNFEEVGYASTFGFVLAGGGTFAYDALKNNHSVKKQEAYEKLTDPEARPTTDTMPRTEAETRELIDIVQDESVLSPYRHKMAKLMSNWLPERLQNSPTFIAYKRGGVISAFAHKFDTMPGLSTKTDTEQKLGTADGEIYQPVLNDGKTSMDVKYELAEHQLYLERDRTDAYNMYIKETSEKGVKPMSKEAFSEETWKINQEYSNRYNDAKQQKISGIRNDEDMMSELTEELYTKKEIEVAKLYKDDATYNKLEPEAQKEHIAKEVEEEVNRFLEYEVDLAAREQMKDMPEYNLDGRYGGAAEKALQASMDYYENMNKALQRSGMPHSEYFDPRFYSPRIYDVEAINKDISGAKVAFEQATRESVEYKAEVSNAQERLNKEIEKDKAANTTNSKERVNARNKIEIEIQAAEVKLGEAEAIQARVERVLDDPYISPIQKSIELTRVVKFSDQVTDPSVGLTFIHEGYIYRKHQLNDGSYEIVSSNIENRTDSFADAPTEISVEKFDEILESGAAEPLTREQHIMNSLPDKEILDRQQAKDLAKPVIERSETIQELMTATGTTLDDIIGSSGAFRDWERRIGTDSYSLKDDSIITHELLHNLAAELRTTRKGEADIHNIQMEMTFKNDEILRGLEADGIDIDAKRWDTNEYGNADISWRERVRYMTDPNRDELFSIAFSNPEIAKVLNRIKSEVVIDGKKISILDRLIGVLLRSLGIDPKKLNHNSILGKIVKTAKTNAKHNPAPLKKEAKIRSEYKTTEAQLRNKIEEHVNVRDLLARSEGLVQDFEEFMASKGITDPKKMEGFDYNNAKHHKAEIERLTPIMKASQDEIDKLVAKSDKAMEDLTTYHNERTENVKVKMEKKISKIKEELSAKEVQQTDGIAKARTEIKRLEAFPKLSANKSVENISKRDTLSQMGFPDQAGNLKGRQININAANPEVQKFMKKNEALNNQIYHYSTSGRIAVKHATGFHNVKDFKAYIAKNNMFPSKADEQVAVDLFELTLGTRQISEFPDANWNKAVRQLSTFNYITMGGQFAKYGMSEIGAGIFANGLGYLSELIPAMGTVAKMYKGQPVSKMEMDMISMSEAGEIWTNNTQSKYGDYEYQESTFSTGVENTLKSASKGVFRWSGLEGISTITKIALPRAFLRRILTEANEGKGAYDLIRWGLQPQDIAAVRKQPIIKNDSGTITDFNFENWDTKVRDKFQTATSRMSRDAILRPDATRVPAWMNDGGANPLIKLSKQFMSFAAMANERLLLRGMNERQAYAATGAIVSGAVLAAIEISGEELAVSMGLMDEKNKKYDLNTEKGRQALGQIVVFRNSFAGTGQFLMESIIDFNKFNGGERMIGKVGSATTGKVLLGSKAAKEYLWNGKKGTAAQTHFIKGSLPFNNMFGLDSLTRNITKDIAAEAKERKFHQNDGGFDGFKDLDIGVGE